MFFDFIGPEIVTESHGALNSYQTLTRLFDKYGMPPFNNIKEIEVPFCNKKMQCIGGHLNLHDVMKKWKVCWLKHPFMITISIIAKGKCIRNILHCFWLKWDLWLILKTILKMFFALFPFWHQYSLWDMRRGIYSCSFIPKNKNVKYSSFMSFPDVSVRPETGEV